MVQEGASFPPSFIATILFITIGGLGICQLADKVRFFLGPSFRSLDAVCPADGSAKGGFACDGGTVARRSAYNISGAEQVRRLSSVSSCDFDRVAAIGHTSLWPPSKPLLMPAPSGWSLEQFRRESFVERFKTWRWPLSTFLRDPWLTLVDQKGSLRSGAVEVSLEEYLQLRNVTGRNIFLFLRDESDLKEGPERAELRHRFFETLELELPPIFRTALRIFAMDGLASGHGMHRHKEAFLASLAGRKLWWAAPPHVESGMAGGRPNFLYKELTPEEGGWPCSWLLQEELVPPGVLRCVQGPGEVVLLPAEWWHMTCSLDEFNIAVGGQEA